MDINEHRREPCYQINHERATGRGRGRGRLQQPQQQRLFSSFLSKSLSAYRYYFSSSFLYCSLLLGCIVFWSMRSSIRPSYHDLAVQYYDVSSSEDQSPPAAVFVPSCHVTQQQLNTMALSLPVAAAAFNEFRRRVAQTNPSCFSEHRDEFVNIFLEIRRSQEWRRRRKHLNLHIPKAAGTALCEVARENHFSTQGGNCWFGDFCPIWCGCQSRKPNLSCEEISVMEPEFIMNENWLDHPLCDDHRTYSIVVRDPVARAMSHVNHYQDAVASRGHGHFGSTKGWRLNLIQSNYMTWSLIAGDPRVWSTARTLEQNSSEGEEYLTGEAVVAPMMIEPTAEHLDWAKDTLRQFDYILLMRMSKKPAEYPHLQFSVEKCLTLTLQLMGMNETSSLHEDSDNTYDSSDKVGYREKVYESLNQLDLALFDYALELISLDCAFFEYALNYEARLLSL